MQKQLLLSLYRGIISVTVQKVPLCIFRYLVIVQVVIQYVKRIHSLEVTSTENICLLTLEFRDSLVVRDAANMHSFWNNQ